jgi:SAM-dependent methyltransferase
MNGTIRAVLVRRLRAVERRLAGSDRCEAFIKTDWSEYGPWSIAYRSGQPQDIWDYSYPSPELVGYVTGAKLGKHSRVLDVGCGSGQDAVFLASGDLDVHGLDFSAEALRLAERRARARRCGLLALLDALSSSFEAAYFDLVTDHGCFHHLGEPRRRK